MKKIYINKEIDFSPIMDKINDIDKRLMEIEDRVRAVEKCNQEQLGVGFKADEVFIPSVEEYEKYRDTMPHIGMWWWLRSPGNDSPYTAIVYYDGSVYYDGFNVGHSNGAVRPMIHLPSGTIEINAPVGAKINLYNFPWVVIDKHLAIAEVPIAFKRFDETSNDYEESHIRQFLLDWIKGRKS